MDFILSILSPTTTILLAASIVFLYLLFRLTTTSVTKNNHNAPPQARGAWPIVGHLPLLAGPRPPHIVLGNMADKHGPIFTIRMGIHQTLVVSNWETAKECLTTHDRVFADRPATLATDLLGYQRSMVGFSTYGTYWRQVRKIATLELLSSHRLELLKTARESEVKLATKELYGYWAKNVQNGAVSVEITSWFSEITLNVILKMIVGKSIGYFNGGANEVGSMMGLFKDFFELSGRFLVADGLPYLRWLDVGGFEKAMKKTAEEMDVVVGGWLKEHKDKRDSAGGGKVEDDFMDVLLNVLEDEGSIDGRDSDTTNKATCLALTLAASDTTSVTMTWLLSLLINHPDFLRKAQIELDTNVGKERQVQESDLHNLVYLKAIVNETMRLYPAAPLSVPHQSMEDCTVAGHLIRGGTRLIVNISKIQRDPQVWVNPDEFRPDRFLTTHKEVDVKGQNFELIPFGSGRRMCPGLNFALQVMYLTVGTLLHGFDFSRVSTELVDMTESIGLTNPKAYPLEVMFSPRLPAHLYQLAREPTFSRSNLRLAFPIQPPTIQLSTAVVMLPAEIEDSFQPAAESLAGRDKVVVAVKAEKVISKASLAWALSHVVHPGDCITLLAVFPEEKKTGKKFWSFPRLTGDCGSSTHRQKLPDRVCEISESCSQMVLQFHNQIEVRVRIKVVSVSATSGSAVVAEAKRNEANWVVVDKKLKHELKHCIEELRCNIVLMKGSQAKVLRLNLGCSNEPQTPYYSATSSPDMDSLKYETHRMKHSTPVSSPEESSGSYLTGSSFSSYSCITPPFLVYEDNPLFDGGKHKPVDNRSSFDDALAVIESDKGRLVSLTNSLPSPDSSSKSIYWIPENHAVNGDCTNAGRVQSRKSTTLLAKFRQYDQDSNSTDRLDVKQDFIKRSSVRNAVSLGRTSSVPPPLCSFCQHKAPLFGKPPRQFSYEELDDATGGFSDENFLSKGGFGHVYRGVLSDGQVVAVKLLKCGGPQADADFCREVKVLSCAQHRNVVLLIGFCIDENKRILVYEYICNGSLDSHLHGNMKSTLDWHSRLKVAIGTARGLRYLHEDCRVGCIVHRDMRPDNILVTHDFEPLVADFGLARRDSEWGLESEECVIGTSGYLAPEYVNEGTITDKVDVYAFGVVLLELMTGRRISEMQFENGQHLLFSNWFQPLSTTTFPNHLLDPCLRHETTYEVNVMARAATLCLHQDPELRPSMSKVLRILEGGDMTIPLSLDLNSVGSRSGHLRGVTSSNPQFGTRRCHSRKLSQ
ncbi:Cytochrome P450 82A1 (Fragment) [Linum grandiflorum]